MKWSEFFTIKGYFTFGDKYEIVKKHEAMFNRILRGLRRGK
jgi:hypothetical protein